MTALSNLEKTIGITFKNKELLKNAFIHRSYLNENKTFSMPSNEKLEFLGDSVLSLVTSIYLYKNYPLLHEGDYTDIKASIVKTESLYEAAADLKIGQYLYLSKGEDSNNGRNSISILADSFEALIATIFLDQDFETAYNFISKFLFADKLKNIIENRLYLSAKNKLQEYLQNKHKRLPQYQVISQTGPEHNKMYQVGVYFNEELIAEGRGKSKKIAEEIAASNSLQKLKI